MTSFFVCQHWYSILRKSKLINIVSAEGTAVTMEYRLINTCLETSSWFELVSLNHERKTYVN